MVASNKRVVRVAIIGGGISSVAQAVRLQEALGDQVEFTIYERAKAFGGVWRDSVWPGSGVDVPIHLYSLYSHLNGGWSEKYAGRDEVLAYWNSIVDSAGIRDRFKFQHEFVGSKWNVDTQSHTIEFKLADGSTSFIEADVIVSAAGSLNKPIYPNLEGIDSFEGKQWHSSQWQSDVDLRGKRVGVIGNGSSGIQLVPNIAQLEGIEVTQFIRSPSWLKPKPNFAYSPLKRFIFTYVPFVARLYRWNIFWNYDVFGMSRGTGKWSNELREKSTTALLTYLHRTAPAKYHDILTPDYPMGCKRVTYNAGWLESLHRPNVSLIADPIARITPTGLVTKSGVAHELDVIVWATGFDAARTGVGLNYGVFGEEKDMELRQLWEKNEGAYAYLGVAVPRFPNYFTVLGPNSISQSFGYTLGNQTEFIARLIKGLVDRNLTSISPKELVTEKYNIDVQDRLNNTVLTENCTAWYRWDRTGKVSVSSGFSATELFLRTRKIKWEDWAGKRGKDQLVELKTPASWSPFTRAIDYLAESLEGYIVRLCTVK